MAKLIKPNEQLTINFSNNANFTLLLYYYIIGARASDIKDCNAMQCKKKAEILWLGLPEKGFYII